jgi:hypothetical protein
LKLRCRAAASKARTAEKGGSLRLIDVNSLHPDMNYRLLP